MTMQKHTPIFFDTKSYLLNENHFVKNQDFINMLKHLLRPPNNNNSNIQENRMSTFKYTNHNSNHTLVTEDDLYRTVRVWIEMRDRKIGNITLPPPIDKFLKSALEIILNKLGRREYNTMSVIENIYLNYLVRLYGKECAIFANNYGIYSTLNMLNNICNSTVSSTAENQENIYHHLFEIPKSLTLPQDIFNEIKKTILQVLNSKLSFISNYDKDIITKLINDWYSHYVNCITQYQERNIISGHFLSYFKDKNNQINEQNLQMILYCIHVCVFLHMLCVTTSVKNNPSSNNHNSSFFTYSENDNNNKENLYNDRKSSINIYNTAEDDNDDDDDEEEYEDIFFSPKQHTINSTEKKLKPLSYFKRKLQFRESSRKKKNRL